MILNQLEERRRVQESFFIPHIGKEDIDKFKSLLQKLLVYSLK